MTIAFEGGWALEPVSKSGVMIFVINLTPATLLHAGSRFSVW